MKNSISKFMLLLLWSATMFRCSEDEQTPSPENVAVTFSFSAGQAANGRLKAETPDVLYLSLTKSTGEPVVTYQKVQILSVGASYISEPVSLPPGSYRISDFLLADEASDSVLFAAPKQGSALAKFVSRPLPYAFSVASDKIANIAMEVIDVSTASPADFGYVAFQIQPVNPLSLSVFLQTAGSTELVTAHAFLLAGTDTAKVYQLGARVNAIGIPGNPQTTYTLVVVKPGYGVYTQVLKYSDLTSKAIGVFLSPALSIVARAGGEYTQNYGFRLEGEGMVYVDWGDGTAMEPYALGESMDHIYASAGNHFITVTGDLDKITWLGLYYYPVLYVDPYRLTELRNFQIVITTYLPVVDMSKNTRLEKIWFESLPDLQNFILPEQHLIRDVRLINLKRITTPVIDNAIGNVYNTARRIGILTGRFDYYNYDRFIPNPELIPIGPPSASAIARLTELRDSYGWSVTPLP
jgi:hypothetical protein